MLAGALLLHRLSMPAERVAAIAAAGGVAQALQALQGCMDAHIPVGVICTLLLRVLTSVPDGSAQLAAAGGLAILLNALRAHQHVDFVAARSIACMMFATRHAAELATALYEAGGWPDVVAALRNHAASPTECTKYALHVLGYMAATTYIPALERNSAMDPVVGALAAHAGDADVVLAVLDVLALWIGPGTGTHTGDSRDGVEFVGAGGVAALVAAVRVQLSNPEVVRAGFNVLCGLDRPNEDAILAAGGLDVCAEALRAHVKDADVLGPVLTVASELCRARPAAGAFFAGGTLKRLRDAQCRHAGHSLALLVVWKLYYAAAAYGLIKTVDDVGGWTAVHAALRYRDEAGNANLVPYVCMLLVDIEADAAACGACIPALVAAWKRDPENERIVVAVTGVLAHMLKVVANVEAISAAGCLDMAVAEVHRHLTSRKAARNLCAVLGMLLATLRQREAFIRSGAVAAMLSALRRHPTIRDVAEGTCASIAHLVTSEEYGCHATTAAKAVRPLPQFFEVAKHADMVLPAVASCVVPAAAAWLSCTLRNARRGFCACRPIALMNVLSACPPGAAAVAIDDTVVQMLMRVAAGSPGMCEGAHHYALAALCHLAANAPCQGQMLTAGVVKPLVAQLDEGSGPPYTSQRLSLSVLVRLTATQTGATALTQAGDMQDLHRFLNRVCRVNGVADNSGAGQWHWRLTMALWQTCYARWRTLRGYLRRAPLC